MAHAAFEARHYPLARTEAEAVAAKTPRESVYLLLADIEEAEGGPEGRVRAYMQRALRAPKDPAWTADGVVSREWRPFSPVTGKIDAFTWKAPMEAEAGEGALLEEVPLPPRHEIEQRPVTVETVDDGPVVEPAAANDVDAPPAVAKDGETYEARKEARFN